MAPVVHNKEVRVAREGLVIYNAIACDRLNKYSYFNLIISKLWITDTYMYSLSTIPP